jgi:hypothetical protein
MLASSPAMFPVQSRFPTGSPIHVPPANRAHLTFRGTRLLTGLILGFAGLVLLAFGALAVPNALDRAATDPGLVSALGVLAPFLVVLGIVHLVAGYGVVRDRSWGFTLGLWSVAFGTLAIVAGLVLAVSGRDAFAIANPAPSGPGQGLGILLWTLAWYAIAAGGLQRVIAGRVRG